MPDPKPLQQPVYEIPLDNEQLILVGRIAAIWAQVELSLTFILAQLLKLDLTQLDMLIGDKMVGSRADVLLKLLGEVKDPAHQTALRSAYDNLKKVVTDRNMVGHGIWGYDLELPAGPGRVSIYSLHKSLTNFRASSLPRLHDDLTALSHEMFDLWYLIKGLQRADKSFPIPFSFGEKVPPGGREVFFRQSPLDRPTPDHTRPKE